MGRLELVEVLGVLSRAECRCGNNKFLSKDDKKNYIIDVDGVVCQDICNCSPDLMGDALVNEDARNIINGWYDDGNTITFFTARVPDHEIITRCWLLKNGFKYHNIIFGKPRGGNYHYIDDKNVRATRFDGKFGNFIRTSKLIEVFE